MKPTKDQLAEAIEDYAAAKATNRPNLVQATGKRLSEYVEALFAAPVKVEEQTVFVKPDSGHFEKHPAVIEE
jgi:hypothetical protein